MCAKIKTSKKRYPKGWDIVSPTLDEFEIKMREAENDPHDGKRKAESQWPIFRIHHQRSRYIYEMFYRNRDISREVYEFCLQEGYADKNLIAKWKKQGYEKLCCLKCVQDLNHICICRVPRKDLSKGTTLECINCGCRGCASGNNNQDDDEEEEDDGDNNDNDNQQQQEEQQEEQQNNEEQEEEEDK